MYTEHKRKYSHDYHIANREKISARKKSARRFKLHILNEIKLILGCKYCGFDKHPSALEFHHRDESEKEFGIARATTGIGLLKILAEVEKCDVLCANCHQIHHAESFREI